jgi:hypothetical protein
MHYAGTSDLTGCVQVKELMNYLSLGRGRTIGNIHYCIYTVYRGDPLMLTGHRD